MLDLSNEPDLGYILYPHEIPDYPGHPRLDVIISATPTYRHFDPKKAQFHVVSPASDIEHISIHHPWTEGDRYRVCAGRIFWADRKAKRVEAFSFGGELHIQSEAETTVCVLESGAPIFPLFAPHDLSMWITAEVEILLARQKAHWDPQHPQGFETHLATIDPFLLYACCLQALQDKVDQLHTGAEELDRQGQHFVHTEIQRLQEKGKWPVLLPTPARLFRQIDGLKGVE